MAYVKCKWLENNGRRVTKIHGFACICPLPPMPVLPASVTEYYAYQPLTMNIRRFVGKDDCASCPCFTPTEDRA